MMAFCQHFWRLGERVMARDFDRQVAECYRRFIVPVWFPPRDAFVHVEKAVPF